MIHALLHLMMSGTSFSPSPVPPMSSDRSMFVVGIIYNLLRPFKSTSSVPRMEALKTCQSGLSSISNMMSKPVWLVMLLPVSCLMVSLMHHGSEAPDANDNADGAASDQTFRQPFLILWSVCDAFLA